MMGRVVASVLVMLMSIAAAHAQSNVMAMNSLLGRSQDQSTVTFVDIRTKYKSYEGFGLVHLYCIKDGLGMVLGKVNGIVYAINGVARGMYKNGEMYAIYSG
ncbi:hypothetical protein GU700_19155 [Methylobacterium sp. NI91]|nr:MULTISPECIES: hypothetical protein [unclassified Methylobacterium]QIJ76505.1 hypothetical protein CLZ_19150 [Methylobacterium sp. CLZ]QIJ81408.1 hypothetical protein GU700_19155 [Methylobacterium sp. NI91]